MNSALTISKWLARLQSQGQGILRPRRDLKLRHARLTAFGATRFAKNRVDRDRTYSA